MIFFLRVCSSFFLLPGSSLFLDLPRSFFFIEDIRGSAEGCDHRGTGRDDYDVGGAGGQRPRPRQGQRHDPKRRRDGETVERQTRTGEGRAVLSLSYHYLITALSLPYLRLIPLLASSPHVAFPFPGVRIDFVGRGAAAYRGDGL